MVVIQEINMAGIKVFRIPPPIGGFENEIQTIGLIPLFETFLNYFDIFEYPDKSFK